MKLFPLLALTLVLGTQAKAADGSLDAVKKSGKLRIACDMSYPPMEFEEKGGFKGFGIDFAEEVAKRIGVKADFQVMGWDGILAGLTSSRYDTIICTMNITPDREKQATFVEYARMAQLVIGRKDATFKDEKDLAGKVIAVQADTTSYNYAEDLKKKGVAIKEVKAFKLATDAFNAVKSKQAEIIIVDEPVGRFYAKQDAKTFSVLGQAMTPEPIGIAVRKKDAALAEALRAAVKGMQDDGTMKKLQEKWFGSQLGS
jgi:polar amino acid transport system substrate-binding protein